MNILLTTWQSSGTFTGKEWISRFKRYGVEHSIFIELPNEAGLDLAHKNLIFVFKEPNTIADITAIGYGSCYAYSDSSGGLFYINIKEALDTEQFSDVIELTNSDYALEVSKTIFDSDKPLSDRKEALEKFLIGQYSWFIFR
jgi:hypothetical protein